MHQSSEIEPFSETTGSPVVRGFIHGPAGQVQACLVLTHGAGSNCNAPLLISLSEGFATRGIASLRCDLPYRQRRAYGPPRGTAAEDQAGLQRAVDVLRNQFGSSPVFMGGVSYGGRQATILAATEPDLVHGLIILSYPLHPPGKPQQLRIGHLPKIQKPALFVSGTKDKFGSPDEIKAAAALIPAKTSLISIEGVGHDLGFGRSSSPPVDVTALVVSTFVEFFLVP